VLSTTTKTPLSRDVVVDRALQLAEAEGLSAVTIRRLAQEFDVTPMALYWHFRKKDDLLAGLGQRLLERIELPEEASRPWGQQLRALLIAVLAGLRDHPATAPLAAAQIMGCERGLDLTERTLEVLAEAGFTPDEAAQIAHRALQSIIILVTDAPGVEVGASPQDIDQHQRTKRVALASLSPERYPRVVAAAAALTTCEDEDAYFNFGLELLLAGVSGLAAQR
jgi:AcrR family transcriptional regulator